MGRSGLLIVLAVGGCLQPQAFPCQTDAQCVKAGSGNGTCQDAGYCSFPDGDCPSMQRFSELAPPDLAGECVDTTGTGSTSTSTSSTTIDPVTSTSDASTSSSSSGEDPSTTSPVATEGSSSTGEPVMPEPLGWWRMDDDAGVTVFDHGTGRIAGDLRGGPVFVPGHIGGALDLDGANDYVDMGSSDKHKLSEFTVAAWIWIQMEATAGHPTIIGKNANYRLRLEGMSTRAGVAFHDPDATPVNESLNVTCGSEMEMSTLEWHHVAATYEIGEKVRPLRLYVDGDEVCVVEATGGDGVPSEENGSLIIGYWHAQNDAYFNGLVDDVRLYDVPLSPAQIQILADM